MKTKLLKLLSAPQRSFLGGLADGAFRRLVSRGAIDPHDEDAQAWRRRQAREATAELDPQRIGWTISEAPATCFNALKSRFEALAGETGKALDTMMTPNDVRQLAHGIEVVSREIGVTAPYVQGICKRMFGRKDWQGAEEGRAVLIALKDAQRSRAKKAAAALAAAGCV